MPELGFDCFETQRIILRELEQCAPDRLETIAGTGVKAVFLAPDAQGRYPCLQYVIEGGGVRIYHAGDTLR